MGVIILQNLPQELVLAMVNRLDDVLVISRKVEKTSTLSWRSQFRQDIFAGQGHEVIGWIKLELCSQMSKHPRGVVLEFEIVFCRGSQFITSAVTN